MTLWQVALILAGIPALLGSVFVTIGLLRVRMTRNWERTTGVVVDRRTGLPHGGLPALYPTFQWQDHHGRVHRHTSSVRQSFAPAPGKHVPVRFDPESPQRAVIDTVVQSGRIFAWVGVALLTLAGTLGATLVIAATVAAEV